MHTYFQGVNQKITIGTVRPQLGKRALVLDPNVAGGSGGGGVLWAPPSHSGDITGPSALERFLRP